MNMLVGAATFTATATPVIAAAEATSPNPIADSKLLALADEYVVAEQRWGDLVTAVDEMCCHRKHLPEVLRIRPQDLELGRKPWEATDEFWHRPCDIRQWRCLMDFKTEYKEEGDRSEIVQWTIKPSEELSSRGAEIVAAFDAWYNKKPRGYKKAVREMKRAERAYLRLEAEIYNTQATTIEGMRAKIRCAQVWQREEIESINGGCSEAMALSIFQDILRMTENRPS